jgi:hypothetical protein
METFPHGPDGPLSILAEASDGYYLLEQDTLSWKATRLTETGPNQSATVATGGSNTWILINGRTLGEEFPQ